VKFAFVIVVLPLSGTICHRDFDRASHPSPGSNHERKRAVSAVIGVNHTKRKLAASELVLAMAVNQMRTPNVAMIAAARGFDTGYILGVRRANVKQLPTLKLA
jgi:hypothetical protein